MKTLQINMLQSGDMHKAIALEKEWDKYHSEVFDSLKTDPDKKLTEEQSAQLRSKTSAHGKKLGLSKKGENYKNISYIEKDSVLHPDHGFKIGTIVDGADDLGISTILGNLGLMSIHTIFNKFNDLITWDTTEYIQPDWHSALDSVNDTLSAFKNLDRVGKTQMVSTVALPLDVYFNDSMFKKYPVTSPMDALSVYHEQRKHASVKNINKNFVNSFGWFYLHKALSIRAAIAGTNTINNKAFPCTYLVYNTNMEWYVNGLEIVKETIEHVLSQPEDKINQYWMRFIL